jgi:large conductance mechanosensitive channel
MKNTVRGHIYEFMNFIREQKVVSLAVGFILGGAVTKLVNSLVQDMINPILGIFLGAAGDLNSLSINIGSASVMYGKFIANIIDFAIIAWVVYTGVKVLKFDRIDKKQ